MATTNPQERKAINILMTLVFAFGFITWVILCFTSISLFEKLNEYKRFGPVDVAERLTSPDGNKTAILARSYASLLDMNFMLFISDEMYVNLTDPGNAKFYTADGTWKKPETVNGKDALWLSGDHEYSTSQDWYEEVTWSSDSMVVAIRIQEEYVFAYDFSENMGYVEKAGIERLLAAHMK